MVFTGDIQQIDQPYLDSQSNGLIYMIDRMRDQNLFAHINLVKGERSQLSELASNYDVIFFIIFFLRFDKNLVYLCGA